MSPSLRSKYFEQAKITMGQNYLLGTGYFDEAPSFRDTGISHEMPIISNSGCGKPSISYFKISDSKYLVFRSKFKVFDENTRYFD